MAKKTKNKKKHTGRWELYESKGGLKRKNKSCPICFKATENPALPKTDARLNTYL